MCQLVDVPVVVRIPCYTCLCCVVVSSLVLPENPVFGVSVEVAVQRSILVDGIELPTVFRQCIDFLEERGVWVYVGVCVRVWVGVPSVGGS